MNWDDDDLDYERSSISAFWLSFWILVAANGWAWGSLALMRMTQ